MKTSHIIGALLVLASAAGCEREAAPTAPRMAANTASGNADGRIAFAANKIFVMGEDGSGVTQLTPPAIWNDDDPVWSPDGTRIAFRSTRDGPYYDIWLMNADGSGVTRLTDTRPFNTSSSPAWSGGAAWCGDRIAFHSNRGMGNDIYVMNADGTGDTQLTNAPGSDITPTWAPACDRLAFATNRDGNYEIYVMNSDGTGVTRLTLTLRSTRTLPGRPTAVALRSRALATETARSTSCPPMARARHG